MQRADQIDEQTNPQETRIRCFVHVCVMLAMDRDRGESVEEGEAIEYWMTFFENECAQLS